MNRDAVLGALVAALMFVPGCGSDVRCTPGHSVPCACETGDTGAQVCLTDKPGYGECVCAGKPVDPCTPDCSGKCGGAPDGCDGSCSLGCADGSVCVNQACVLCGHSGEACCESDPACEAGMSCQAGLCACASACAGKCGGADDGCGGLCTEDCGAGMNCVSQGCTPCGEVGEACCNSGVPCDVGLKCDAGQCTCFGDCTNKCGGASDGCGGLCSGSCGTGMVCINQACAPCGGASQPCCTSGTFCQSGLNCHAGQCSCTAVCTNKCGGASDGCGGTCNGSCGSGTTCVSQACVPCGAPGQSCCGTGAPCQSALSCQNGVCGCTPACTNKCGGAPDGCGGTCNGACAAGMSCVNQSCQSGPVTLASGLDRPWNITIDANYVYWVENAIAGAARRVPKGGGTVETLATGLPEPTALLTDGSYAYVLERNGGQNGRIDRIPIAGGSPQTVVGGLSNAQNHIATDGTYLYFGDYVNGGVIKRVAKLPGSTATILVQGNGMLNLNTAIAVDAGYVYFHNDYNRVLRTTTNGGAVSDLGPGSPAGMVAYGSFLYFVSGAALNVARMPSIGGSPTVLATLSHQPGGVATDGGLVFWVDFDSAGGVWSVPVSGGQPKSYSSEANTLGVAADSTYVYWSVSKFVNQGKIMRAPK